MPAEVSVLLGASGCVGFYRGMVSEVDLSGWLAWCAGEGVATALPRLLSRDSPMEFARWRPGDSLADSGMGFEQPDACAPLFTPDLICVPMLGFDRALNRLGQGAGHYDRYFASNMSALRIGIAWSIQEITEIETEDWDVPMDAICTENEWICPLSSRIVSR